VKREQIKMNAEVEMTVNPEQSIECDRCDGGGMFAPGMKCYRCGKKGILTRKRILDLRDNYFPQKVAAGSWGAKAAAQEIEELNALLRRLDGTPEPF
jgi:hypothetical protein